MGNRKETANRFNAGRTEDRKQAANRFCDSRFPIFHSRLHAAALIIASSEPMSAALGLASQNLPT